MYSGDLYGAHHVIVTVVFILVPVIAPALGKICAGLQSGMDSLYSGSY
jgi:hypothetical protein